MDKAPSLDIVIPTFERPASLAVTLTSLASQTFRDFRLVISDQSESYNVFETGEVQAALNVLQVHGHMLDQHRHLPRRGIAEHRKFLLDQVQAPYVLFLDDDLILEPWVIELMMDSLQSEGCGFAGSAVIGLSYLDDVRPEEQAVKFWEGPVEPEAIHPDTPEWERYRLHNAANLYHVQQYLGIGPENPRHYKIAWVGGCVLYDVEKLKAVGGFSFWREVPAEACGEDVLVQRRVMRRYGGFGLMPSGVYHQELPTTLPDRRFNAPRVLQD